MSSKQTNDFERIRSDHRSEVTEDYLEARRKFFMGVSQCKEDPEEFGEPFVEYCLKNKLLKEKEEQLERAAFWNELASSMSHEIRNPLAGISGAVQILRDSTSRNNQEKEITFGKDGDTA